MRNRTNEIILIFFYLIASIVLAFYIPIENGVRVITVLPDILGVLLGGILASLAIIFGLLSSKDLERIKKDFKDSGKDPYVNFLKNTKFDAKIIFFSLVVSIIILVIYDIEFSINHLEIQKRLFFSLSFIFFFFSLSSAYDIILSLFYLNELRYTLSTKKQE